MIDCLFILLSNIFRRLPTNQAADERTNNEQVQGKNKIPESIDDKYIIEEEEKKQLISIGECLQCNEILFR